MPNSPNPHFLCRNLDTAESGNIHEMDAKHAPSHGELYSKASAPSALYDESALKSDMDGTRLHVPRGAALNFNAITDYALAKDSQNNTFAVYTLTCSSPSTKPQRWEVFRRYQEFRDLSDELRSSGHRTPVLPPKKTLGTLEKSFLEQRKRELEAWMHQLIEYYDMDENGKDPRRCEAFRKFLTQMANQPPFPMERNTLSRAQGKDGREESKYSESKNDKICIDDFKLIKVIGKGSFGKVTLVEHKESGDYFAMKVLKKANVVKRKQVEHTRTERRVLGGVNHPFIVRLHYAFQTDAKLFFVLDYCPGGELFFHLSRMKKMPEHMARFYTAEITLALGCLHEKGIVYRDLKVSDSEQHSCA